MGAKIVAYIDERRISMKNVFLLKGYGIMIKAVIFDLDGVLVTTDVFHFNAWKKLAEDLGIMNFTKADNARQRGVSRMASLEVVLEKTDRVFSDEEKQ